MRKSKLKTARQDAAASSLYLWAEARQTGAQNVAGEIEEGTRASGFSRIERPLGLRALTIYIHGIRHG